MHIRNVLAGVVLAGCLLAAPSVASANELKEPAAHFVVDVPDSWTVGTDGSFAVAYPKDQSFHLRMQASSHGVSDEAQDEKYALQFLQGHFTDVKVEKHGKKVDFNNFAGVEVFGSGKLANGAPGKFFLLVLVSKKDTTKGGIVVGTGTSSGFDKHQPGIREALRTMRTY